MSNELRTARAATSSELLIGAVQMVGFDADEVVQIPGASFVEAAGGAGATTIYRATWADLSALTVVAGANATVPDTDTGTHTDPVVGGTVPNAGIYLGVTGSPSGWRRIGATQVSLVAASATAAGTAKAQSEAAASAAEVSAAEAAASSESAAEDATAAEAAKALSQAAATNAGTSAELAASVLLTSGITYPDTTAGLAAVANGEYFWTDDLRFYRKVSGAAVLKVALLTESRFGMTTPEMADAVGDGVADDRDALAAANALGKVLLINRTHYVGSDLELGAVMFGPEGMLIPDGAEITIAEIANSQTLNQIFDPINGGSIVLLQREARPDWWGNVEGNIMLAGAALNAGGGGAATVLLDGIYPDQGHVYSTGAAADAVYWLYDNISLLGRKMPELSDNCSALENGTIIRGTFLVYANNARLENLGVDCGKTFCDANTGGTGIDALVCTYASQEHKNANALRVGLTLNNVIGLANHPNSPIHAVIAAEGYSDVSLQGDIIGCMGQHGVVIKARNVTCPGTIKAYCNSVEGFIIKTDAQTTAVANDIYVSAVRTYAACPDRSPHAVSTTGAGVMINPQIGNVGAVQIDDILTIGHPYGFLTVFGALNAAGSAATHVIDGLMVGKITTVANSVCGISFEGAGAVPNKILRSAFGDVQVRNTPLGMNASMAGPCQISIGSIHSAVCGVALDSSAYPTIICPTIIADANTSGAVRIRNSSKPLLGSIILEDTTPRRFATDGGGLTPALAANWANLGGGGNSTFAVEYAGGSRVALSGHVVYSSGATAVVANLPAWARPVTNKRLSAIAVTGGSNAIVAVMIVVGTDGTVNLIDAAGGITAASAYLCLDGLSYSLLD